MTATNHALTGAVIGLAVSNPWVAIPAALASHLICDAVPHFGSDLKINSTGFKTYLSIDASLCVLLVICLFLSGNPNWLLASFCAFVATSPDFIWVRQFRLAVAGKPYDPSLVERFLAKIQWFERPIGAVVELAWFSCALIVLSVLI